MNNWQLLLTAGAPTLTVLVGILLNERRGDRIEARIDRVEAHIERVKQELKVRIDRVEAHIERVKQEIEARIDRISDDLRVFYRDLGRHEAEITNLKQRS